MTSEVIRSRDEPSFCSSTVVKGSGRLVSRRPPRRTGKNVSETGLGGMGRCTHEPFRRGLVLHHHHGRVRPVRALFVQDRRQLLVKEPVAAPVEHGRDPVLPIQKNHVLPPGVGWWVRCAGRPWWARTLAAVSWIFQNDSGTKFCTRK